MLRTCSLLRNPRVLYDFVKHIIELVDGQVPVSVKMRAGFDDSSLFSENIAGIEAAGASFVTVHPRTRRQGYSGKADWSLIGKAKSTVSIPVVQLLYYLSSVHGSLLLKTHGMSFMFNLSMQIGNGDVNSPEAAMQMWQETHCDGIMIGRGMPMILLSSLVVATSTDWAMLDDVLFSMLQLCLQRQKHICRMKHILPNVRFRLAVLFFGDSHRALDVVIVVDYNYEMTPMQEQFKIR